MAGCPAHSRGTARAARDSGGASSRKARWRGELALQPLASGKSAQSSGRSERDGERNTRSV